MSLTDWASTVAALTVILTFIGAFGAWIFKKYADQVVNGIVKEYLSELKPNGGGSLRDDVKELRKEITAMNLNMARLEGRFAQHLAESDSDIW